jgi:indole-3-glycerol phosphate synthase
MAALVEVHGAEELDRALASGATLIGINNRDLTTFRTDLAVTEALLGQLPEEGVVVSESGIATGEDVARLGAAGVHAVLVGESILRADDPGARIHELAGQARRERSGSIDPEPEL